MDIKDSYLHSSLGVVKSLSITADKLTYNLADIANTSKTITMPLATKSANGLLSKEDKTKIDNIKDVVKHYTLAANKYLKISLLDGAKSSEFMITGSSTTYIAKTCAFYSTYDPGGKSRAALKLIHKGVYEYYIDNPTNPSVPVLYIKNYDQTSYINILSFTGTYCDVTEVDSIPDTAVKHTDENILATVKQLSQITQLSDITAGNSTLPVYFKEGVPTPITVGLDGSLFATVGTNPTWTTDFRTLGWYKITGLHEYDSTNKITYYKYVKLADLNKTGTIGVIRVRAFDDVNYPLPGEWIIKLNHYSGYTNCVTLLQNTPSNLLLSLFVDKNYYLYAKCNIKNTSSLRFCIENYLGNNPYIYTSNWEIFKEQPADIIATIHNHGFIRITTNGDVLYEVLTSVETYKYTFTSDYFKGALLGNADTTTKLLNARTLWGLSFDGTANISGAISNTGNITPSSSNAYSVGTKDLGYRHFYAQGSGTDIGLIAINTSNVEKPTKIGFIIGSDNIRRGIYDYTEEGWMMYRNTTNIYFPNGNIGIGYNGASVPERLSVNGTTQTVRLKISSTANEKHIEFSRGSAHTYPYNYIATPVGGIISILPNGISTSSSNGILFSGNGIHPGTTKGYSLGTDAKYWDKGYIGNIFMDSLIDYSNYPEAETFKMGLDVGTIHFKGGINDNGNSITWGYGNNTIADSGIYVKHNGSYGSRMYLATTNLWDLGPKVTLQLEPNGLVIAPRNTIKATGFVRNDSSNNYILLGGGGHKLLSDFVLKTDILNDNLTTITKSLKVTTDWMDTGIVGDNLTSGTYIVLIKIDAGDTLNIWNYTWSGTMSWFSGATNDNEGDEIYIHGAGHASAKEIYLRTVRTSQTSTGRLKLLIASSIVFTEAIDVTFKFKRII